MSLSRILLTVSIVGAAACSRGPTTRAWAADRNAVYAAVLDSLYLGVARRPVAVVVVSKRTGGPAWATAGLIDGWRKKIPGIPGDLWGAFGRANAADSTFLPIAGLREQQHVLVTGEEQQLLSPEILKGDPTQLNAAWATFYSTYPGSAGIAHLSNVGFSKDGNWALVYLLRSCASLCAEGYVVLLQRTSQNWLIAHAKRVLVS